ncbi:hypothetical protein [Stenotrophomonas rhizophila]
MDEGLAMEKAGWAAQLSAVLLVWELQLLAVPMTALSMFALAWLWGPAFHPDHVPMRAAVVVALIALVGFWRLVLGFYRAGLRLDGTPLWARVCTAAGATLCAAGLAVGMFQRPTGWAYIGVMGVPMLLPLGHMLALSWRTTRQPPVR